MSSQLREIHFTVDSQLLRELGERLVGRQYIALAELVKNSYDADATKVEIRIEDDLIEIVDNGHGMTFEDFKNRWMRIGSAHKVAQIKSPRLGRPLTGSKGVGRLAVQFLASELELQSVPTVENSDGSPPQELHAIVDWDHAVMAGELTRATALYDVRQPEAGAFPIGKSHGTRVRLTRLKQGWEPKEFESLAKEIWFLEPPFRRISDRPDDETDGFKVELIAPDAAMASRFNTQMSRILDLYRSRIVGRLLPVGGSEKGNQKREVQLSLELEREPAQAFKFTVPVRNEGQYLINSLEFEIRIFNLAGRQGHGIPVQLARGYMSDWGGVHIYDAGFRIPYAGPEADWLLLEVDHSHRMNRSRLLPDELQVPLGLNHLPTNSRVLGVVHIDTTREALAAHLAGSCAPEYLQIQVSRDRLVSNEAFFQLRDTVRFALDYYATRLKAKQLEANAQNRRVETPTSLAQNVWDILDQHEDQIPKAVATRLKTEVGKTIESIREQSGWATKQSGLLGAMATVGVTAMALDHQFNQQLNVLEHHATLLEAAAGIDSDKTEAIGEISQKIKQWIQDARDTRAIFSPIADERNREAVRRFRAKPLVTSMVGNIRPILRGVTVEVSDIDQELMLPETSYPVWMAIFHNLFMNCSNAMLDSEVKRISVSSFQSGRRRGIRIQDTGVGIDLDQSEGLFEPLHRGLEISAERRALGYGGTGLGLSIVRMLATDLRADVHFVEPTDPFKTCLEIAWSERP